MKILWANAYCLLDTSSGASMACRQMLHQLAAAGHDVEILGATIFDHPRGIERLRAQWDTIKAKVGQSVSVRDGKLTHRVMVTADTTRERMSPREELLWFNTFMASCDRFQPDVILYYGGQVLDFLMTAEARHRGIKVVAFLCNGNFVGRRWCRDVDLILTDSQATARHYAQQDGLTAVPIGAFIDPRPVIAVTHERRHVLFVNPSQEKGAAVVIQLAMMLEHKRPDIKFEIVESRGNWQALVRQISAKMGQQRDALSNVILTPNTTDMRPIYGRARLLLAPSLWWESFGRVAAEAVMNGIPVIHSGSGGLAEVVGDAGIRVSFPTAMHKAPYTSMLDTAALQPLASKIEQLFDDDGFYQGLVDKAKIQAQRHSLAKDTGALMRALNALVKPPRASDFAPVSSRKILISSFVGGPTSMGRVGEALLSYSLERGDIEPSLLPFPNDPMISRWGASTKQCVDWRPEKSTFHQQIRFSSVLEQRQNRFAKRVTPWFFHDVDSLPNKIVDSINSNDLVFVTSGFVGDVFRSHGVTVPIHIVGMGYDPKYYQFSERRLSSQFTFLCVAEHTSRKNLPMLIRAFERAFGGDPAVRLVIKTGVHDASSLRVLVHDPRKIIIDSVLREGDAAMSHLYEQANCFVLPTRLEGFGMPILEAMATGLPVIVTDYSGHLDFCNKDNAFLIRNKGLVNADPACFPHLPGRWGDPDEDHLIFLMRSVVDNYSEAISKAHFAYEHVRDRYRWSVQLAKLFDGLA